MKVKINLSGSTIIFFLVMLAINSDKLGVSPILTGLTLLYIILCTISYKMFMNFIYVCIDRYLTKHNPEYVKFKEEMQEENKDD